MLYFGIKRAFIGTKNILFTMVNVTLNLNLLSNNVDNVVVDFKQTSN